MVVQQASEGMAGEAAAIEHVRKVFRAMLMARLLEAKLASLYKAGKIVGGVYIGKGQEAVSGALGTALVPGRDILAPLIRDQAARTAFGEPLLDCTRTYIGSVLGPMRGRDGNVHRGRPLEGMPVMISHLGTQIAVVAGMLFARRLRGQIEGVVGATFIGDGATSTGACHEAMNLIGVERLPMVLVVVNNQFAYSTPNDRQFACKDLLDRAQGYGMDGHKLDGTDMFECIRVIGDAVRRAREGMGPQMVVAEVLRLSGHGEHDDAFYVPEELRRSHVGRDCMEVGARQMLESGVASAEEIAAWKKQFSEEVQQAVAQAQREPAPDPYKESWSAVATKRLYAGDWVETSNWEQAE